MSPLPPSIRGRVEQQSTGMIFHRGVKIPQSFFMSSLCFSKPTPINLRRASWTNRDEAVTCADCRRLLKERRKTGG